MRTDIDWQCIGFLSVAAFGFLTLCLITLTKTGKLNKLWLAIAIVLFIALATIADANPLLITKGGTYSTSEAFEVQTTEAVTMSGCGWSVGDNQAVVTAACAGANLTIENSSFVFVGSNPTIGEMFSPPNIWAFKSLVVHNCFFNGNGQAAVTIYGAYNPAAVSFYGNIFENCRCAWQLNAVRNAPSIYFGWNQIASGPANKWNDQVSIYDSSGVSGSPIVIDHNYVQVDPNSPFYPLGGGISAGDYGSCYVVATGNVLANCGIGLWWPNGNTSKLIGNTVIGRSARGSDAGGFSVFPNAGYAIGNSVAWYNTLERKLQDYYFAPGVGQTSNSCIDPSEIDSAAQNLFWLWDSERLAAKQTVGPQ